MANLKPPRFRPGDRKGSFLILDVLGHERRQCKDAMHFYRVKCECGAIEEIGQHALAQRRECRECAKLSRSISCSKSSLPVYKPTDIEMLALHRRWK